MCWKAVLTQSGPVNYNYFSILLFALYCKEILHVALRNKMAVWVQPVFHSRQAGPGSLAGVVQIIREEKNECFGRGNSAD